MLLIEFAITSIKLTQVRKNINANVIIKSLYEIYLFSKTYEQMSFTEMEIARQKFLSYYNQ